jgi:hypothetical protein
MRDAEPADLNKIGIVTITRDGVTVEGFGAVNGSCRDVSALAALWAIGELQRELMETLKRPGGGRIGIA